MDAVLLRRWIDMRDAEAFRDLAHKHLPMIYATCLRILRNPSDAEDVSQECLVTLAGIRQAAPERVGPWLHRVATNKSLNALRTNARRSRHENDAARAAAGPTEHAYDDVYACIDELIQQLPDELRDPLITHFFQGETHADIAATLGITRSAVTHRIDRAIRRIREGLRRRGHACSAFVLTASLEAIRAQPQLVPEVLNHATARIAIAGLGEAAGPVSSAAATGLTNGILAAIGGQKAMVFVAATIVLLASFFALPAFRQRETASAPQPTTVVDRRSSDVKQETIAIVGPASLQSHTATTGAVMPPAPLGAGSISGIVVNAYGAPQRGKLVYALGPTETGSSIVNATTDSHGQFSLTELPENNYAIRLQRVDASGPERIDRAIVRVANAQHVSGIRIESQDVGLSISGTITDVDGNSIVDVLVSVNTGDSTSTKTDDAGQYRITGIREGTYVMWVHPPIRSTPNGRDSATPEYMTVRREGVKAGSENVDVVLGYPVKVTGRLVHAQSGKPVTKYRVLMYPAREEEMAGFLRYFAHTLDVEDSDGRFEVMAGQEGTTKVFAQGLGTDTGFAVVDIVAGRPVGPVEIRVADGLRVEGTVVSSTGLPVEGARIYPYGDPGAPLFDSNRYASLSDAQGRFAIDGIGEGPFYVEAIHPKLGKGSTTIYAHRGGTPSSTIQLTGFGAVEGRVTSNGRPVAGAIVTAGVDALGELTGPDGQYRIDGVRGGAVTVAVKGLDRFRAGYPNSVNRRVFVAAGSKATVDFDLQQGTSKIAGRIVGDVALPSRVSIHARAISGEDRVQYRVVENGEGHFEISNVAAGTVLVEASLTRDDYRSDSRAVHVAVNDDEQIEQDIVFESETTLSCDVASIAGSDGVQVHLCPGSLGPGSVTAREVFDLRVASNTSTGDQPVRFSGIQPGTYTAVVFNADAEDVSIGHLAVAQIRPGELNQIAFAAP